VHQEALADDITPAFGTSSFSSFFYDGHGKLCLN